MSTTNFERLIETLFQIPKKKGTFKFPYVDHSQTPPEENVFEVKLTEQDAKDILTIVKQAANKQRLQRNEDILFTEPVAYPDPDAEIKRRLQKFISDMLVEAEQMDNREEKRKLLKEIRLTAKDMKPNMSISKLEWDKIVSAFKEVNPDLTEDEILAAFKR